MTDLFQPRNRKILPRCCIGLALALIATILLWPMLARAAGPAQLCEVAAQQAAARHGVPLAVLRTIALVETGRTLGGQMQPWPWAIHAEGRGHWPASRAAALELVRNTKAKGVRNIDIGCFQINLRWHGAEFASLEAMIEPAQNADYAARLLQHHKARLGSWEAAAGAYHSATPALAARYRARFAALRGKLSPPAPQTTPETGRAPPPAENRSALLQPAGSGQLGSLVSMAQTEARARLIELAPGS